MPVLFDRKLFDAYLTDVAERYEKTAPTVEQWCDFLAADGGHKTTLADVTLVHRLATETTPPSTAANLVYHLNHRLGRDTTGQAGF